MSKLFARLAGGGKKKEARSTPPASSVPPTPVAKVPSYSSSNGNRSSPISPRPPRIDLDFGTTSSPVASTSPAPYSVASTPATSSRNGKLRGDLETEVVDGDEATRLAREPFDWKQVEHAWSIAGKQLLVIGLETPHLFELPKTITSEQEEQINRLLAIFILSTSSSPLSVLALFPSLTDLYPAPEFIPSTPGWFDNDFTTHIQAVKDPRVLVEFLRRLMSQLDDVVDVDAQDAAQRKERGGKPIPLPPWYITFTNTDTSNNHPPDAYTTLLGSLIPRQQQTALSVIFDSWLRIDDSSRFNSTSARFLSDITAWWLMSYPSRLSQHVQGSNTGGLIEWQNFYDTWVEAGEAVYRLFLSWIRNQPTSTLPLRATELVQSYPAFPSDIDTHAETDVLVCNVTYPLHPGSTKRRASDILPDSSTEMLEMLLAAVDRVIGSRNDTVDAQAEIGSWQSITTANETASPDSARDGTTTLQQIIEAIRDAQQSSSSSSRDPSGMRTPPANSSTEEGPLYRPFRTPSSSSFMQGVDTPDRSPSANGGTPLSTRNASALGFPPESPHSVLPTLAVARTEPDPSWMDFAQSGFDGDGSKLPEKPFVLGEAFKEAPQMAKASSAAQKPGSQTPATLGIGRPGQRASHKSGPQRSYVLKSVGVTRLRPAFFEFERDARRIPRATEGWPSFMAIPLDKSVIRQFSLRSKYMLVLVDVVEPQQPDVPPVPIEKDQDSAIRQLPSPLQTPPPPPPPPSQIALAAYPSPPADDSDKRNRRRSFFRSFSGGSNKNRRSISSPLSSPSLPNPRMTESPLPPVAEKREPPLPSTKPTESPLLTTATAVPSPPRGGLLEPYRPNHSRSTSSVHRKPAPVLDQNELRELERSESRTRNSNDMRDPDTSATVPLRTTVVSEDNVEVIRTDSLSSTSSTKNDSDSPKSLPRRRRSMAPSPASIGDARQVDDGVPTDALNKLALDDKVQGESDAQENDDTVTGSLSSDGPALVVEPDVTEDEIREIGEPELRINGKGGVESATSQAPVLLGPVLSDLPDVQPT